MLLTPAVILALGFFLPPAQALNQSEETQSLPSFDYEVAQTHEVQPHRRTIPHAGIKENEFSQLHLTLLVNSEGHVAQASAEGDADGMKIWPDVRNEVMEWMFSPFEAGGKPTAAKVEEYVDLVPPERMPKRHVPGPVVHKDSRIVITLTRSGCLGTCPAYRVRVSTTGIEFDGEGYVTAVGSHSATTDPAVVRELAKKFMADDFYSMDSTYEAGVTDCPTYTLAISVDGQAKSVRDYMGSWIGMPQAISELEDDVDNFAQTKRWIEGTEGLTGALRTEGFNFNSYEAQVILKEAATRGQTRTVQELLDAGVPLKPLPAPQQRENPIGALFEHVGWLNAASSHPETLKVLLDAGASENNQDDLNMALLHAARAGKLDSVRELIASGADPNADFSKQVDEESFAGMTVTYTGGAGSVLIGAATSGNPELVREILRYHPDLEARDRQGNTAVIAASEDSGNTSEEDRAECIRLLVHAGANVNAKNNQGNTALHETFLTAVEEMLLTLGADVNAKNNEGETPIFTTVDNDAIALYIQHGANLSIRNNNGQTAIEAAADRGPLRVEAFRKAVQDRKQP